MICLFAYRYSVENAYLEEKEDTCNALGEIAENSGQVGFIIVSLDLWVCVCLLKVDTNSFSVTQQEALLILFSSLLERSFFPTQMNHFRKF